MMLSQAADQMYRWQPLLTPAPVWDYWYLLLVPLCLAVAVVYKAVRCASLRQVPREALVLWGVMLAGLMGMHVAVALVIWLWE
jgi:uncharacterized membrane protein YgcG